MGIDYFKELKTTRIYEKIVAQIRQLIVDGKLLPGDRLPAERELAQQLGCSRTSLREACRVLESEGLIVSKPGGGRFIQDVNQHLNLEYEFSPIDLLEKSAIFHFIEAREALEPVIAYYATERATESDYKKMEKILKAMKSNLKKPADSVSEDSNFHLALAEATKNFVFISLMRTNLNMYRQVRKQTLQSANRYEKALEEHYAIFEALKRKDCEGAKKAMQHHLQSLKANVLNGGRHNGIS